MLCNVKNSRTREELKRAATAQENSQIALSRQAENLKISADLTANSTLLKYYLELELVLRRGSGLPTELTLNRVIELKNHYLTRFEDIIRKSEALEKQKKFRYRDTWIINTKTMKNLTCCSDKCVWSKNYKCLEQKGYFMFAPFVV